MDIERFEYQQPIYGGVNVLRIGDVLVDTGHVAPGCISGLEEELDDGLEGIDRVLITHPHIDHVGGSQLIDRLADVPHVVPAESTEIIHDYKAYIQEVRDDMTRRLAGFGIDESTWNPYFPARDDFNEDAITIDREVGDGDTVTLGDHDLEVIHTSGHSLQHNAYWHPDSGTCLSADLVSRNGHFMYGPLYADVGAYKDSLERVRALEPDRLVPMHGNPVEDAVDRIDDCLEKAATMEERLETHLAEEDSFYARHFTKDVIGASKMNAGFLTLVVNAFLEHLEERGLCTVSITEDGILATTTD